MCGEKVAVCFTQNRVKGSPPRVRGKEKPYLVCALMLGSPPRVRGKVRLQALDSRVEGITPAYAGKSQSERQRHGSS